MKTLLKRCDACKTYTMRDVCPHCGSPATRRAPARYSPQDRYGEYRRRLMAEAGDGQG